MPLTIKIWQLTWLLMPGFPRWASLVAWNGKECACNAETWLQSQVWEDPWRREWQPTPVFLPGEFYGQRSLVGYSRKESDTTEWLTLWSEGSVLIVMWFLRFLAERIDSPVQDSDPITSSFSQCKWITYQTRPELWSSQPPEGPVRGAFTLPLHLLYWI